MNEPARRVFVTGRDVGVLAVIVWAACLPSSLFYHQVFSTNDAVFSMVAMKHLQDAALGLVDWRAAPIAWPLPDGVTQTDWMLGPALLTLPLRALGVPAWHQYTAAVLLGLLASAVSMKWIAERVLGPGPGAWVAAIVGGLNVSALLHGQHVNLVFHGVPWLGILAAGVGLTEDRPWLAALGGALLASSFHFGFYVGLHGVFVGLLLLIPCLASRTGGWRTWLALAAAFGLVLSTMAPVVLAYAGAFAGRGAIIPRAELTGESLDLSRLLAPVRDILLHTPLVPAWPGVDRPGQDPANPGYLAVILAVIGAWQRPGRLRWAAVIGVAAAILALGPDLVWQDRPVAPAPYRLLLGLPGVAGLRAPNRWLEVVWPIVGLFAGLGANRLAVRRWVVPALGVGLLCELPRLQYGPIEELRPPDFYRGLDPLPPGPVADLPGKDGCTGQQRLLAVLRHGRPLVGGQFARFSAPLAELNKVSRGWPSPAAATTLEAIGTAVVVLHPPFSAPAPDGCTDVDGHRLCVLPKRAPLPAAVTVGGTPVVGMRFATLRDPWVTLRCGDRERRQPTRAWVAVSMLRSPGDADPPTDVFFDAPCDGDASSDPPGEPLSAR